MTAARPRSPEPSGVPVQRDPLFHGPAPDHKGITLVDIFSILLRYRVLIAAVALVMALLKGMEVLQLPHYYTTDAEFMPEGSRPQSQLSSFASQFGINIGSDGGDGPQFYMDLLKSRSILGEVAKKQYVMRTDSGVIRGDLLKLYGASRIKKPQARLPFVIEKLIGQIVVTASPRTAVMTLKVNAPTPELATQIANNLLVQINTFNLTTRQRRAGAERAFVEKRQAEALSELRTSEGILQSFLVQNRDFTRSPTLEMQYSRLNRDVEMRQSVYTSLAAAYEQAKIEEVRDLPVISVLAPPELPLYPESKHTLRRVFLALLAGLGIGSMLAFALAGLAVSTRTHPNDVAEFDHLKKDAVDDFVHPWRPLARIMRTGR